MLTRGSAPTLTMWYPGTTNTILQLLPCLAWSTASLLFFILDHEQCKFNYIPSDSVVYKSIVKNVMQHRISCRMHQAQHYLFSAHLFVHGSSFVILFYHLKRPAHIYHNLKWQMPTFCTVFDNSMLTVS